MTGITSHDVTAAEVVTVLPEVMTKNEGLGAEIGAVKSPVRY